MSARSWQNPLAVNLIRSITKDASEGYYDDFDYREIMSTPVYSRSFSQTKLVYAYLDVKAQYGSESVPGMLSEIFGVAYYEMSTDERLQARRDEAYRLFNVGDKTDVLVRVVWGDVVEASNAGRIKPKNPNQPLIIDYRTERSMLASLVKNGLLDVWERTDSHILRGTRLAKLDRMSSCDGCLFAHKDQDGSYCAATYQDRTEDANCQDYSRKQYLPVKSNVVAYIKLVADDIMMFRWSDAAVTEYDAQVDAALKSVHTPRQIATKA